MRPFRRKSEHLRKIDSYTNRDLPLLQFSMSSRKRSLFLTVIHRGLPESLSSPYIVWNLSTEVSICHEFSDQTKQMIYSICMLWMLMTIQQMHGLQRTAETIQEEAEYTRNRNSRFPYTPGMTNRLPRGHVTYQNISDSDDFFGIQHYSKRATCRWGYRLNIKNNRIPSVLTEAYCIDKSCGVSASHRMCRRYCYCDEVERFVKVSYMVNGSSEEVTWEPLTVGCTCVCDQRIRPAVMPQD